MTSPRPNEPASGLPDETRSEEPWWLDQSREAWQMLATSTDVKSGERGAWAEVVEVVDWLLADRARLEQENAELRAKLDLPCGSCHPCDNWSDETWRRAGRKPPHVHEWDAARAEVTRLRQAVEQALNESDLFAADAPHNDAAWSLRARLLGIVSHENAYLDPDAAFDATSPAAAALGGVTATPKEAGDE